MAIWSNGERARIAMEKLTDYGLNPDHPRGTDQARVCAAILGITRDRANALAALVRQAAMDGDLTKEDMTVFGQYSRVDWALPKRGNAVLRTMWAMALGAEVPRLMSAFRQSGKDAPMGHPNPFDVEPPQGKMGSANTFLRGWFTSGGAPGLVRRWPISQVIGRSGSAGRGNCRAIV